jgi:hypothetical protein
MRIRTMSTTLLLLLGVIVVVGAARDLGNNRPEVEGGEGESKVDPKNFRPCNDQMKYGMLRKSGDAFYQDGLKEEAAKCYSIAVRIHTQDSFALFRLGNLARERNDLRVAAEW